MSIAGAVMQLNSSLIASWRPDIEESEAQSGFGPEQIVHFSRLVNGILLTGRRQANPFRRHDSSSSSAFASFRSAVSNPSVNQP